MGGAKLGTMNQERLDTLVDEAIFAFTMDAAPQALVILDRVLAEDAQHAAAWQAKAEVHFALRQLDASLAAAERCLALRPDDIHVHTSLSRIWMERGDKARAEQHGARARILGWKEQLHHPDAADAGFSGAPPTDG
jgi:tetratricopeptide (TPR) repeat protein